MTALCNQKVLPFGGSYCRSGVRKALAGAVGRSRGARGIGGAAAGPWWAGRRSNRGGMTRARAAHTRAPGPKNAVPLPACGSQRTRVLTQSTFRRNPRSHARVSRLESAIGRRTLMQKLQELPQDHASPRVFCIRELVPQAIFHIMKNGLRPEQLFIRLA